MRAYPSRTDFGNDRDIAASGRYRRRVKWERSEREVEYQSAPNKEVKSDLYDCLVRYKVV